MNAGRELTHRLEIVFSDMLYERKGIDLTRALRWQVDVSRKARVTCITKPSRIEASGRAEEMDYPRLYNVELSFLREDDDSMACLAKSNWFAKSSNTELDTRGWSLKQHNAELGLDPFDVADMGDPAHDPRRDIVMFFDGFIQPDILKPDGVNELLNTRAV